MSSLLQKVRRGLSPGQKPTYRQAVIALVKGEATDEMLLAELLQSRTQQQFEKDIETYRQRVEAAAVRDEMPAMVKRESELKANYEKAKDALDNARSAREQREAASKLQAAGDELRNFRGRFYRERGRVMGFLSRTADVSILAEMAEVQNEIDLVRAKWILSRDEREAFQAAQNAIADFPAELAAATDVAQRVSLKAAHAKNKSTAEVLRDKFERVGKADAKIAKLEAKREKLGLQRYAPEKFELAK